MVRLLALLVLFSAAVTASSSTCFNKAPLLFAFGDSNTDTGGRPIISGKIPDFPEGRTFFHQPTGRICDGRLIVDFLCESMGIAYLTPYVEQFSPDFSNGANFALAGSFAFQQNNPDFPYSLSSQIAQFSFFHNFSLNSGLMSAHQFGRALYLFDIGQNDIDKNINFRPFDQLLALVLANIKEGIQTVYALGGRNFWVHNTGPEGCLPRNVAKRNNSTPVDAYGCLAERNEAADTLNAGIKRMCEDLRREMTDAVIVYTDVFSVKLDLIVNAASYGFENAFSKCVDTEAKTVCTEAEGRKLISWDGVHYTEAANLFVAAKIASGDFSTPPLPFNFLCK